MEWAMGTVSVFPGALEMYAQETFYKVDGGINVFH